MLVLKRRKYERVLLRLGSVEVWLVVLGVEKTADDRPRVLLGIDAPEQVVVLREELLGRPKEDRKS